MIMLALAQIVHDTHLGHGACRAGYISWPVNPNPVLAHVAPHGLCYSILCYNSVDLLRLGVSVDSTGLAHYSRIPQLAGGVIFTSSL